LVVIIANVCLLGSLEVSDVLLRADGKRGRWKVSSNWSVVFSVN